jgi:hypothetical protein
MVALAVAAFQESWFQHTNERVALACFPKSDDKLLT